jgi:hypothetical protein
MSSCRALRILGQGFSLFAVLFPLSVAAASKPTTKSLCAVYGDSVTAQFAGAKSNSGKYLYGSNQWGWDDSGAQCMVVSNRPSCVCVRSCDMKLTGISLLGRTG